MAIDPETVFSLPGYRVGYRSPADGSLALGELYIEIAAPPRLWVGGPLNTVMVLVATEPEVAPINTNVPYASQEGDTLTCTMGTWTGEPDTYAYAWALNGAAVGGDSDTYMLTLPDDVGKTATCVVTASNSVGTTEGPPSNAVIVVEPLAVQQAAVEETETEEEVRDDA